MNIIEQIASQIARDHLRISTLDTQNSDSLDFHDLAVWKIKAALECAIRSGMEIGYTQQDGGITEVSPNSQG